MNKEEIEKLSYDFFNKSHSNFVDENEAIVPELSGMRLFDNPLFGFASSKDEEFWNLKNQSVIGEHFMLPEEWLTGAVTVVSFFMPFSEEVIKSNRGNKEIISNQWLHGRIEGQRFVAEFCRYLNSKIIEDGFRSLSPSLDKRFYTTKEDDKGHLFSSNWSERHVAFICGLGTFGLSKGIITEKGMAGRIGSLITDMPLEPTERKYSDIYQYCTMCGACVKRCPAGAISLEKGKIHRICSDFLDYTAEKYKPRYGCGKCQTGVPCERRIPLQRR